MDNHETASMEIPNLKLAKVGTNRNRRRGAGAWFGGASSAAGGSFGAGAGLTKGLLTILVSVGVSAGAWQYGKMMSAKYANAGGKAAPHLFNAKDAPAPYGDTSKVIKQENSIPNSLGYITESIDGLTPEQRAARAAEAEAARKAEEDAKAKAEAEAKKNAEKTAEKTAAAPPIDVNALTGAGAPADAAQARKIGKLSTAFGGNSALSGGAGLSGGISRNFAGGSDLAQKAQNGALSSMRGASRPSIAAAPRPTAAKSNAKGFAKRQLDNAFTQSRQGVAASKGETSAAAAAAPFDNNPAVGSVIAGPGVTSSAKPAGTASDTSGSANPGGPINSAGYTAACQSADYAPDVNGVCQYIGTPSGTKSATYQNLVDTAKTLMMLICVLALIAMLLDKSVWGKGAAAIVKAVIIIFGVILLGLGAAILSQSGDMTMGGIVMAVGALTVASATLMPEKLLAQEPIVNMAAGALIANAVGSLAASQASASQLQ